MNVVRVALAIAAVASMSEAATMAGGGIMGRWGGEHVTLEVNASGARLMLDCGEGAFVLPASIDRHGNFTARGSLDLFRPGPTLVEGQAHASSATFRGHLAGDRLTLDVTTGATNTRHHLELVRNSRVKLIRCL